MTKRESFVAILDYVKDNADLELLLTPRCKVRNFSYEFAVISKNKILRDF